MIYASDCNSRILGDSVSRTINKRWEPRIAYHHPLLDAKFNIDPSDDTCVWTDAELEQLIEDYVQSAKLAESIGFQFVDVKACQWLPAARIPKRSQSARTVWW